MTSPRIRPALDGIPSYRPGRAAPAATSRRAFKLSSNENPYPPLPGVLEAAVAAAGAMNRYPDMSNSVLIDGVARRFDVPPEHVAPGTGSVAVLYHLLQATCQDGDEVVYAWRSFEAYPIAVGVTGARGVEVPLGPGARHDLDAMAHAVTDRTRVVLVCTPNNPTGPVVHADELRTFVERVPRDVLVVLDEAYREFVRDPDVVDGIDLYRERENVVVLRTFSKAYGLAGLRVGFGLAPARLSAAIRKCALPFGVSHVAQHAAVASLGLEAELLRRVDAIVAERQRVSDSLRAQGWDVPTSEANFVWLATGAGTDDFAARCESAGVVVRPFSGEGCRASIDEPAANDVLLEVAAAWSAGAAATDPVSEPPPTVAGAPR